MRWRRCRNGQRGRTRPDRCCNISGQFFRSRIGSGRPSLFISALAPSKPPAYSSRLKIPVTSQTFLEETGGFPVDSGNSYFGGVVGSTYNKTGHCISEKVISQ